MHIDQRLVLVESCGDRLAKKTVQRYLVLLKKARLCGATLLVGVDAYDAALGPDEVPRKRAVGRRLHQIAFVPHVKSLAICQTLIWQ